LIKKASINILQLFKNQRLSKSDTFIFDYNHNLIECLTGSSRISFQYDSDNRLIKQIDLTPSNRVENQISYYTDSILVTETKSNKYVQEITKWYYYFNESSIIVKDSFFVLKHQYRPPNFDAFYRTDTNFSSTNYKYDKHKNHIETTSGNTKTVWQYNESKLMLDFTKSDNKLLGKTEYFYPEKNHVIKKYYNDEARLTEMKEITYENGKIVSYISINNTFQIEQKKIINLDIKGRILTSCELVSGDENYNRTDCKKIEYIEY